MHISLSNFLDNRLKMNNNCQHMRINLRHYLTVQGCN